MKLLSLIPRSELGNESREIAPHQLARMKPHPLIIDAREERDFLLGHIEGAVHLSRKTLESKVPEIAPTLDTPIVIYCSVGTSCASAVEALRRLGYQKVFSLKGGLQSWLEAGGLVEPSRQRAKAS
ncbi:MAG TPA: rhodanese-like domain-containing protein [Chthoniobacterales bacterium]|jgi:rhodanese-related sulfurtransferase|nr:rhodanese-like domain-containing protein [Chthoniobacterales bacterium]